MTDAERLKAIGAAFGYDDGKDAGDNLLGSIIDLEQDDWKADETCQRTLRRVLGQLREISKLLQSN
jgi:hypothetical protein